MTISGSGGAGGGGKGQQRSLPAKATTAVPVEASNNLFSSSYVRIIDLLGEGEIYGLVNSAQSIYINNTPVQNADGSYNFEGLTIDGRTGTQNQAYVPGFDEVASEIAVGATVTKASPVTRTITNTAVNAVRVIISVPALQRFADNGDTLGADFTLQVFIQYNGGGYGQAVLDTIAGKTNQQYQRQYIIPISGPFPVDVRVARYSDDSTSAKLVNAFSWSSYSEVTYAKLRYPNTALTALRINAKQFSSIPTRSYRVRGILVKIPSNAAVDSVTGRLIYSGVWDGTFGAAQWTSDPAWCLWDLLTSGRYGLGEHLDATKLDKWSFMAASQYASALVPDGFGGYEPRFSCNINIQAAEEAYKVIAELCSVFRAMPYGSVGSMTISQDRPADPSYLFTLANVGPEGFSYSGSSVKTRPTVAVVKYFDLDLRDYGYEVVEDAAGIARYGAIKAEIEAVACSSRGQASRIGKWLLYSEANEGEVVAFTSALAAGAMVRPGQVIAVADPMRAGSRRGGQITAATTTAITVDSASGLTTANGPTLSVLLSNGTAETRNVSAISGNIITVAAAFSSAPLPGSVWLFQSTSVQASTWRVLTVEERDAIGYSVTAISYNASKYNVIEQGLALVPRSITSLDVLPDAPQNLTAREVLYESNGRALSKIQLSWDSLPNALSYSVSWREQNDNWQTQSTLANSYDIIDSKAAVYEIQVTSVGTSLLAGKTSRLTFVAVGKTAPPANVSGLSLIPIDSASAILSWELAPDLDVRVGGRVLIRHSPVTAGAEWQNAVDLVAAVAGNQTQKQIPLLTGTVLAKFEDDTGNRSEAATAVIVTLPAPQPRLLVRSYAEELEAPPFNGNATNMVPSATVPEAGGVAGLTIATGEQWDSDELVDSAELVDTVSGDNVVLPEGRYEFGSTYALPGVFDVNIRRRLLTNAYVVGDLWDSDELVDGVDMIDGRKLDQTNVATYVRATSDDPSGSPTWGPWREFANVLIRGRGFQFRAIATSGDAMENVIIRELGADLELQSRTEQSAPLTSGAGTYAATFANAFAEAPAVGITAYNMASGDWFAVTGVSRTGFSVTFRDSAGAAVSRTFTYSAVGYGRQL